MKIAALVLLVMLTASTHAVRSERTALGPTQQSNIPDGKRQTNDGVIKITIATGGGPYRAAKNTFRVGESIPLVITMTNTGTEQVYVWESSDIYQDRPQLLKDGKPIPYTSYRQSMILTAEKDKTCQNEDLPQQVLLSPNKPVVVDWFNLAEGTNSLYDDGWYDPLPTGKYTLTDRRRLGSCDGPLIESDAINFEVVP